MLIEFRVENHRSLRDEQVLTMEAGRVGDQTDPRPRQVSGYAEKLLTVAGLYGANASGKSNVLASLASMREAVLLSHRSWAPDKGVPREPFAWGSKRKEPSLFEVMMMIEGVRYQYGFLASDESFLEEWLYAWPHGKKQIWFERERNIFKFGENLKGENKLIEAITRPNALFLSAAVQHKHEQLQPVYSWFEWIQRINLAVGRLPPLAYGVYAERELARLLDESTDTILMRFRNLLMSADIGIIDLRVEKSTDDRFRDMGLVNIQLKHRNNPDDAWLPLGEESNGTQALFRIALPLLQIIQEGGIILFDELESSLHPSLAQEIIRQFNNPATNPRNAQLIFSTHDTNLLGKTSGDPELRRDQVWLTEKNPDGATALYPLTDFKPRNVENIERGYLQGRYGAIPFLGNFSLV
jgi:AAA15 family ATPase/GTPase